VDRSSTRVSTFRHSVRHFMSNHAFVTSTYERLDLEIARKAQLQRSHAQQARKGKQGRRDNRLAANCLAVKKPIGSISTNPLAIPPPNWSYLHQLVVAPPIGSISTNQSAIPPPIGQNSTNWLYLDQPIGNTSTNWSKLHQLVMAPPIGPISTNQLVIPLPIGQNSTNWS
jgi:hypothetical protein